MTCCSNVLFCVALFVLQWGAGGGGEVIEKDTWLLLCGVVMEKAEWDGFLSVAASAQRQINKNDSVLWSFRRVAGRVRVNSPQITEQVSCLCLCAPFV